MTAHLEDALQRQVAWLLDRSGLLWCHPANERKCSPQQGARLKAAGVKAGVPDVLIFNPVLRDDGLGVAIELKAGKNQPTPEQARWLLNLGLLGWRCHVCRKLDEVHRILLEYYPDNAQLRAVVL